MTSRAKPSRSRSWDDRERRNVLLNIGFGLIVVAALLLLLIAWGASWYGDHLSAAATVNGQTITKDAWSKQVAINQFRADYQLRRIRTLLAAGHIGASDAETRQSVIGQRQQQIDALSLEQLVDSTIQAELASKQGVAVTPSDIDVRLTQEATTDELRHAWLIAVAPELADGASTPTDAAVAAAKAKADQALVDLRAGKDWETIAKSVSTDATKDKAGDLGFIDAHASLDAAFLAKLTSVAKDTPTEVVAGSDGTFRIGRVTEVIPPAQDATLASQVTDAGISMDDFRAALGRDALHDRLAEAVLAPYLVPGPQRQVSEIFLQQGSSETGENAVRVRHILYSPNHDPSNASKVAADDPAWATAKAEADATFARLKENPALFDSIARAESDETSARTTGGKLPYFSTADAIDPDFAAAIFKAGLTPGQLLDPVKSAFGWHVIQVQRFPTDADWAAKLRTQIDSGQLSFADAARDNSDTAEAAKGGDIGWVGKGQLDDTQQAAIFAAPIGKVSDPLTVPDEGIHLYLVGKEESRAPDAEQKASLESSIFPTWYSTQKAGFEITRDPAIASTTG